MGNPREVRPREATEGLPHLLSLLRPETERGSGGRGDAFNSDTHFHFLSGHARAIS